MGTDCELIVSMLITCNSIQKQHTHSHTTPSPFPYPDPVPNWSKLVYPAIKKYVAKSRFDGKEHSGDKWVCTHPTEETDLLNDVGEEQTYHHIDANLGSINHDGEDQTNLGSTAQNGRRGSFADADFSADGFAGSNRAGSICSCAKLLCHYLTAPQPRQ